MLSALTPSYHLSFGPNSIRTPPSFVLRMEGTSALLSSDVMLHRISLKTSANVLPSVGWLNSVELAILAGLFSGIEILQDTGVPSQHPEPCHSARLTLYLGAPYLGGCFIISLLSLRAAPKYGWLSLLPCNIIDFLNCVFLLSMGSAFSASYTIELGETRSRNTSSMHAIPCWHLKHVTAKAAVIGS